MMTFKTLMLYTATITAVVASNSESEQRWYKPAHTKVGQRLFDVHCASCHGIGAVGDPNWRQPDANGLARPPPLNGSATHGIIRLLCYTNR